MQTRYRKIVVVFVTVYLFAFVMDCNEKKEEERVKDDVQFQNINSENSGGEIKNPIAEDSNNGLIEIGSFSTSLLDDQKNRVENLHIAADCLNNERVSPGEEFSFNGTIGRRTEEKGYKKAPIIKRTKDGPKKGYGVGGGICQLSSTLYNAAQKAGLKITEMHHHSKDVGYVPEGKDATVVYGAKDFKFINNRSNPIVIKASVSEGKVAVSIFEMIK
jgi:vancomycin resistance protein YoaR